MNLYEIKTLDVSQQWSYSKLEIELKDYAIAMGFTSCNYLKKSLDMYGVFSINGKTDLIDIDFPSLTTNIKNLVIEIKADIRNKKLQTLIDEF